MGKIKKITENELVGGTQSTDIYPVTSVKAVYDESNERLDNILNRRGVVNISTNYNADHIAEVLTLEQAIAKVPSKDRVLGFQGKFLSENGWKSYVFIGDSIADWTNKTKWNNYLTGTDIVQESGEAEDKVMSQKAVRDKLSDLDDAVAKNTGIAEYEEFSESKAYNAGDIVKYKGFLYRFITAHKAGAWLNTDVNSYNLLNKIDYNKNKIDFYYAQLLNDGRLIKISDKSRVVSTFIKGNFKIEDVSDEVVFAAIAQYDIDGTFIRMSYAETDINAYINNNTNKLIRLYYKHKNESEEIKSYNSIAKIVSTEISEFPLKTEFASSPNISEVNKILFFGDSLTQGVISGNISDNQGNSTRWTTRLCTKLGVTEANHSISTYALTSDSFYQAIKDTEESNVDLILVEIGMNDCLRAGVHIGSNADNSDTESVHGRFKKVLNLLRKKWAGVRIIFIAVYDIKLKAQVKFSVDEFNRAIYEECIINKCEYITKEELNFPNENNPVFSSYLADGIQPTGLGSDIYANAIYNYLCKSSNVTDDAVLFSSKKAVSQSAMLKAQGCVKFFCANMNNQGKISYNAERNRAVSTFIKGNFTYKLSENIQFAAIAQYDITGRFIRMSYAENQIEDFISNNADSLIRLYLKSDSTIEDYDSVAEIIDDSQKPINNLYNIIRLDNNIVSNYSATKATNFEVNIPRGVRINIEVNGRCSISTISVLKNKQKVHYMNVNNGNYDIVRYDDAIRYIRITNITSPVEISIRTYKKENIGLCKISREYNNNYKSLSIMCNSAKMTNDALNSLKKITHSDIKYGHMTELVINSGYVYITSLQNSGNDGEGTYSTTAELTLSVFSLDRYNATDFNPDTDVINYKIGKLGEVFANYTAKSIFKDSAMYLIGNNLYITFMFITEEDNIAREFSIVYDIKQQIFKDKNKCSLYYNGSNKDFTLDTINEILVSEGYKQTVKEDNIIEMVSQYSEHKGEYYATLVMGKDRNYGMIVKTSDFINFQFVAIPPFNENGNAEIASIIYDNKLFVACRQFYGEPYLLLAYYDIANNDWSDCITVPDGCSRPWFYVHNNELYLMNTIEYYWRGYVNINRIVINEGATITLVPQATLKNIGYYYSTFLYNGKIYFATVKNILSFGIISPINYIDDNIQNKLLSLMMNKEL